MDNESGGWRSVFISYPDRVKLVTVEEWPGASMLLSLMRIFLEVFEDLLMNKNETA